MKILKKKPLCFVITSIELGLDDWRPEKVFKKLKEVVK